MQTETAKPQTTAEVIKEARREGTNLFVLYSNGVGSKLAAAGRDYEAMWQHAAQELGLGREELLKKNYVFDVLTAREAAELPG